MINRRHVLQRDEPVQFAQVLAEIRRLTGYGTGELAFVLNVPRSTLLSWESRGSMPNHDDGQAMLKLLGIARSQIVAIASPVTVFEAYKSRESLTGARDGNPCRDPSPAR